jgi:hypothetical protein
LSEGDRATIEDACKSALEWLETSAGSGIEAEQYEAEQKKLESVVTPIVSKLYGGSSGSSGGSGGSGGSGSDFTPSASSGPNIEEVD